MSGGGSLARADRCDCLDDLPRFREVVGNPDGPAAVAFTINDFPVRRNFSSGRLLDRYSPKANEKIVGRVTFVPCRKDNRDIVVTGVRSLVRLASRAGTAGCARTHAVSQSTNKVAVSLGGDTSQPQVIEWYDAGRSHSGALTHPGLVAAEMRPSMSAKKVSGDCSPCAVRYAFVEHFR